MPIPFVDLEYTGDPVELCCPACGEEVFAESDPCEHIIFRHFSGTDELEFFCEKTREEFYAAVESAMGDFREEYDDPEDFIGDMDWGTFTGTLCAATDRKSAFCLAITTHGFACGPVASTLIAGIDLAGTDTDIADHICIALE